MPTLAPACPLLPEPAGPMDWQSLHIFGDDRGPDFFLRALEYGQYLWQRRLPARAMLCLDRALGADLDGFEAVLRNWPLPYQAMAWVMAHADDGLFIGNPRVHFQHLAGRLGPPRQAQRSWRAWACWYLSRLVFPDLPGDSRHLVDEPSRETIATALARHGIPGEVAWWEDAVTAARPRG